jgi:type I restriction enzyme S subunit
MSTEVFYGPLPEGWERKELGDIAETQLGKMLNSSKQTGSALKPYLRNINLQWGRIDLSDVKEMDIFENEMKQFMLAKGDVLVCEGGEPGRSAVWNLDIEMGFQNAIHRIRPRERLSPEFACYQFEWLVKNGILDELFTGVTIKHFSQQKLRKVEFVVPPLNEQEKIVEILEEQLSRLDAALASVRAVREKSARFRRSLLHAAFTGALTGHDASSGNSPKDWMKESVGDFVSIKTGKIDVNAAVENGAYPFFTCAREIYRIDEAPYEGRVVLIAGNGDLNVKYYEGKFNAYQRTYFLAVLDESKLLPKYLYQFMEMYVEHLRKISIGTTIKYIKLGDLRDATISLPPMAVQEKIVEILEEQLSRLESAHAVADAIEKKASALRRSLLHAAFTGALTKEWREGTHV